MINPLKLMKLASGGMSPEEMQELMDSLPLDKLGAELENSLVSLLSELQEYEPGGKLVLFSYVENDILTTKIMCMNENGSKERVAFKLTDLLFKPKDTQSNIRSAFGIETKDTKPDGNSGQHNGGKELARNDLAGPD